MVIIDLINTCLAPVTVIQLLHIFLLFVQCNYYQIKEIHQFFFLYAVFSSLPQQCLRSKLIVFVFCWCVFQVSQGKLCLTVFQCCFCEGRSLLMKKGDTD